jgi:hypothetical protein
MGRRRAPLGGRLNDGPLFKVPANPEDITTLEQSRTLRSPVNGVPNNLFHQNGFSRFVVFSFSYSTWTDKAASYVTDLNEQLDLLHTIWAIGSLVRKVARTNCNITNLSFGRFSNTFAQSDNQHELTVERRDRLQLSVRRTLISGSLDFEAQRVLRDTEPTEVGLRVLLLLSFTVSATLLTV